MSLNAAKISGACGRLMCCLRYEYDTYLEEAKLTPKVDSLVRTPDGVGTVIEAKPLLGLVKVQPANSPDAPAVVYSRDLLKPLKPGEVVEESAPATQPQSKEKTEKQPEAKKNDSVAKNPKNQGQKKRPEPMPEKKKPEAEGQKKAEKPHKIERAEKAQDSAPQKENAVKEHKYVIQRGTASEKPQENAPKKSSSFNARRKNYSSKNHKNKKNSDGQ